MRAGAPAAFEDASWDELVDVGHAAWGTRRSERYWKLVREAAGPSGASGGGGAGAPVAVVPHRGLAGDRARSRADEVCARATSRAAAAGSGGSKTLDREGPDHSGLAPPRCRLPPMAGRMVGRRRAPALWALLWAALAAHPVRLPMRPEAAPPAAFLTGPDRAVAGRRGGAALRRAADRSRLEKEAGATEGFLDGILDFFGKKAQARAQSDPDATKRREEATVSMQKALKPLRLSVIAGADDDGAPLRREAPIAVLQAKAKQGLLIFAATSEQALLDVLLSMRISADEFKERNILVVPALFSAETRMLIDFSPRFSKSKMLNQGGVALIAAGAEERAIWGEMFADEFVEAASQGVAAMAKAQGIAFIVRRSGQVARRGVGRPDWAAVFADLGI